VRSLQARTHSRDWGVVEGRKRGIEQVLSWHARPSCLFCCVSIRELLGGGGEGCDLAHLLGRARTTAQSGGVVGAGGRRRGPTRQPATLAKKDGLTRRRRWGTEGRGGTGTCERGGPCGRAGGPAKLDTEILDRECGKRRDSVRFRIILFRFVTDFVVSLRAHCGRGRGGSWTGGRRGPACPSRPGQG